MTSSTTNLGLRKPDPAENWSVQNDFNENMERIDSFVGDHINTAFGTFSNATELATILDTLLTGMRYGGVKTFQVDCSANFDVFKASTRYFGTLYKTGSSATYGHVDFRAMASVEEISGRRISTGGWEFSSLYSKIAKVISSYSPSFAWSTGGTPPTVENITASYTKISGILFVTGRFNITNLNSPNNNSGLLISLPSGFSYDGGIGNYGVIIQDNTTDATKYICRAVGTNIQLVWGASGGYATPHITTGYYEFTFWIPIGF